MGFWTSPGTRGPGSSVSALRLEDPTRGVTVTLTPERSYGRSGDPRSVSFLQRPDVAVEIGMPDGDLDMLLFDPKYKLDADDQGSGLPVKSDVDKMHALINDLEQRLPTSITLGVQQAGGLVGLHIQPPSENTIEQELLRVRRAVDGPLGEPGLLWLLPQIAVDPHHMLSREDLPSAPGIRVSTTAGGRGRRLPTWTRSMRRRPITPTSSPRRMPPRRGSWPAR